HMQPFGCNISRRMRKATFLLHIFGPADGRCLDPAAVAETLRPMRLAFFVGLLLSVAGVAAEESAYRLVENWAQLPAGTKWATMTAVDIDAPGTVYVLQRGAPANVMAFDAAGKLLRVWGDGTFPNAHGLRVDRA